MRRSGHPELIHHVVDERKRTLYGEAFELEDVDCHWKWREMALLTGVKPEAG